MDSVIDALTSELKKEDTQERLKNLVKPLLLWIVWEMFPFILMGWFSCLVFAFILLTVIRKHSPEAL